MSRVRLAGLLLSVVALAGYLVGARVAYTGRSFSVTLLMVGLTLVAIGGEEW